MPITIMKQDGKDETFKYKEDTREVLKSRHVPSTIKEEEQNEDETESEKI